MTTKDTNLWSVAELGCSCLNPAKSGETAGGQHLHMWGNVHEVWELNWLENSLYSSPSSPTPCCPNHNSTLFPLIQDAFALVSETRLPKCETSRRNFICNQLLLGFSDFYLLQMLKYLAPGLVWSRFSNSTATTDLKKVVPGLNPVTHGLVIYTESTGWPLVTALLSTHACHTLSWMLIQTQVHNFCTCLTLSLVPINSTNLRTSIRMKSSYQPFSGRMNPLFSPCSWLGTELKLSSPYLF